MKQSPFDKYMTSDPNGDPAPEYIHQGVGGGIEAFDMDELHCQDCGTHIGYGNFIYHDVGGERGEIIVCVDCACKYPHLHELLEKHEGIVCTDDGADDDDEEGRDYIDRLERFLTLALQGFVFAWREMFMECRATITGKRPDGEPESRFCDNGCGYRLPHEYAKHETTCGACLDEEMMTDM